jgi:hypothetical protein
MASQADRSQERLGLLLAVVGMILFTAIGQTVVLAQQLPVR